MNTRYVIPITVALAAHGGLLFGFTKSPRTSRPANDDGCLITVCGFPLIEDEPEVAELTVSHSEANKGDDLQPPRSEEPPGILIDVTAPTMTRPPITTGPIGDTRIVPAGFVDGVGNGKESLRNFLTGLDLDNPPRTRFQVAPIYPFEEKKNGVRGEVLVDFEVDETGVVHNARVARSSSRAFEEPTLRAVAKWRFEPGKRLGKVVAFRMSVPVIFSLNED